MYRIGKTLVLAPGEEADDVDIKLVQGGVITGRVTDADGKPVIEERINLQMVDQAGNVNNQANIPMWNYQMSQTDDRGIYRIYGLSAGRYRVSVGSTEGGFMAARNRTYYAVTFYGNTSDAAKASVVELQDGTEATNIDIRVGRAANTFVASGRIVDAENGQPIPNLRLIVRPRKSRTNLSMPTTSVRRPAPAVSFGWKASSPAGTACRYRDLSNLPRITPTRSSLRLLTPTSPILK